jgi:DnaJ-class molecular chaperone
VNDKTKKGGADCEECQGTGVRECDDGPRECIFCDGTGREDGDKSQGYRNLFRSKT